MLVNIVNTTFDGLHWHLQNGNDLLLSVGFNHHIFLGL